MHNEQIAEFAQSLRGTLIGRDDAEYDQVRALYNAMIDKRPLLIARGVDVADVIAAVNSAETTSLPSQSAAAATTDLDWPASTTGWSSTCRS
jgi:hypothetical protein